MFDKVKSTIKELAKTAVIKAEEALGSNKGQEKKKMAIEYIIQKLPFPAFLKPVISFLFSSSLCSKSFIRIPFRRCAKIMAAKCRFLGCFHYKTWLSDTQVNFL